MEHRHLQPPLTRRHISKVAFHDGGGGGRAGMLQRLQGLCERPLRTGEIIHGDQCLAAVVVEWAEDHRFTQQQRPRTIKALQRGARIMLTRDAAEATADADVVVTDTWISMGQAGGEAKLRAMMPYQVNAALMARARPGAKFLHCLPAHREEEVTGDVIDGPQSLIWDEAENRLHAQKSVLLWCFGLLG